MAKGVGLPLVIVLAAAYSAMMPFVDTASADQRGYARKTGLWGCHDQADFRRLTDRKLDDADHSKLWRELITRSACRQVISGDEVKIEAVDAGLSCIKPATYRRASGRTAHGF